MRQAWTPVQPQNDNMPKSRIKPYRPPRPTFRELMEGRAAGTDDRGFFTKGYPARPPKSAYQAEDRAPAEQRCVGKKDTAVARRKAARRTRGRQGTVWGRRVRGAQRREVRGRGAQRRRRKGGASTWHRRQPPRRKTQRGREDQRRDKRGAAATEVQSSSVVRARSEGGKKKRERPNHKASTANTQTTKTQQDLAHQRTHRGVVGGGGGQGTARRVRTKGRGAQPRGEDNQDERASRGTSRSNLCSGHKTVCRTRATGLLAPPWGINTG